MNFYSITKIFIFPIILITLSGADSFTKTADTGSKFDIEINQINQVSISTLPKRFEDIKTTDTSQIYLIIDYLNSMKLVKAKTSPRHAYGSSYLIKIQFKNKSERTITHSGNSWLIERNNIIYKMNYKEAIKIDKVVAEIIERNSEKNQTPSIEGTIVSIGSLPSGRPITCVIKDRENKQLIVNLKKAPIVDATGSGWIILHEKDDVKIFFSKGKKSDVAIIFASMVIIKMTHGLN